LCISRLGGTQEFHGTLVEKHWDRERRVRGHSNNAWYSKGRGGVATVSPNDTGGCHFFVYF